MERRLSGFHCKYIKLFRFCFTPLVRIGFLALLRRYNCVYIYVQYLSLTFTWKFITNARFFNRSVQVSVSCLQLLFPCIFSTYFSPYNFVQLLCRLIKTGGCVARHFIALPMRRFVYFLCQTKVTSKTLH